MRRIDQTLLAASSAVSEVEDIVVGPLLATSSKFKTEFHCSKPEANLAHLRGPYNIDVTQRTPFEAEPEVTQVVDKPVVYAGPLFLHFAHFIADSTHKLWIRKVDPALRNAKVAFHVKAGAAPNSLPLWALETFDLLGLQEDAILYIDRPTRFSKLILPMQGRVLGGATRIEGYQQLFPFNSAPIPSVPSELKRLYVSRSRHRHSGCYLGESYVEKWLAGAGFTTIFPEAYSIPQAVRLFMDADEIVFAEGGAIQLLQLCGKIRASVFVIGRRVNAPLRFADIAANAASKSRVFESVLDGVCLSQPVSREPRDHSKAANFIDFKALTSSLGEFFGIEFPEVEQSEVNQAIREDLVDYLLDPRIKIGALAPAEIGDQLRRARWLVGRLGN